MSVLRRIVRGLELDAGPGGNAWTVRLEHGVHLVRVRQWPLGDHIIVDGTTVARTEPWDYERTLRFRIADAPAELRMIANNEEGTLRRDLYVGGELVRPDVRPVPPAPRVAWRPRFERAAYVFGGVLALAGLAGDPIFGAVRQVVWSGALLVLFAGLRAVDPLGVITLAFDKMLEDRVSMLVAGIEIAIIAAIAADRRGSRRRLPFIRERRTVPRVLGWVAIVAIAFAILEIS